MLYKLKSTLFTSPIRQKHHLETKPMRSAVSQSNYKVEISVKMPYFPMMQFGHDAKATDFACERHHEVSLARQSGPWVNTTSQ